MKIIHFVKNTEAWRAWKSEWLKKADENQTKFFLILVCSFFALAWVLTIAFPVPPEIAALNLQVPGGH